MYYNFYSPSKRRPRSYPTRNVAHTLEHSSWDSHRLMNWQTFMSLLIIDKLESTKAHIVKSKKAKPSEISKSKKARKDGKIQRKDINKFMYVTW